MSKSHYADHQSRPGRHEISVRLPCKARPDMHSDVRSSRNWKARARGLPRPGRLWKPAVREMTWRKAALTASEGKHHVLAACRLRVVPAHLLQQLWMQLELSLRRRPEWQNHHRRSQQAAVRLHVTFRRPAATSQSVCRVGRIWPVYAAKPHGCLS